MLVVTRKIEESLIIGDNIEVTVLEIGKDRVKLGIAAPRDVSVVRNELIKTKQSNIEAAHLPGKAALDALLKGMKGK
jgi:carbon storage regulator